MRKILSLGDGNSNMIAVKYRYLDPSMVGVLDLNVSSNSDIGMSGSFVPTVKLYDGFFFTPEHQPCKNRYEFDKALAEMGFRKFKTPINGFEEYIKLLENGDKFKKLLELEPIEIVERAPDDMLNTGRAKNSSSEDTEEEGEVENDNSESEVEED